MAKPADVQQVDRRGVVDSAAFERWLLARKLHPERLARGDIEGITLDMAKLRYIGEDPVLWCRAFLREPNPTEAQVAQWGDPDEVPYTFFDYQEESIRAWMQDAIHQDGAEVGKTREITALILWAQCTGAGFTVRNPSVLVAAPQQTHLDEIIRDIELHVGVSDGFNGTTPLINRFWLKPKKNPHYLMRFKGPTCTKNGMGLVYFRPGGHDGEAFRGVHVNAFSLFDEAAKVKAPVVWSEFHRSLMPGCRRRYYSVPDGDTTTDYYRMTQEAIPNLAPGLPGLRLFHWPKTLMPSPFWDDVRKQKAIAQYGGETSSGYVRNVHGLHGQQENAVWPFDMIMRNTRHIAEYVALKLTANEKDETLHVLAYAVDLTVNDSKKLGTPRHLADKHMDLRRFKDETTRMDAVMELLNDYAEPLPHGVLWGGADLGFSNDPTEILISQEVGHQLRDRLRIHAKGVDYTLQCALIYCLHMYYSNADTGSRQFFTNWGADFGNAGTAVVQQLQGEETYSAADFKNYLSGFNFANAMDCQSEDGEALMEEKNGKQVPVRKPAKNLATEDLITPRFQAGTWLMPYDPDVVNDHTNHTAKQGQKHLIYNKKNDHTIDARRALILRKTFNESASDVNICSSGAYVRPAA